MVVIRACWGFVLCVEKGIYADELIIFQQALKKPYHLIAYLYKMKGGHYFKVVENQGV